ncbi:hypothetical protein XANCAGTX0491_007030 [Xanthoria calcicola]
MAPKARGFEVAYAPATSPVDEAWQTLAETKMAVASAVIVPGTEEQSTQPLESAKRRNSSFSEESSKRPRLTSEISRNQTETSYSTTEPARVSDRRKSGQLEERKRGQRLKQAPYRYRKETAGKA